MFRSWQFLELTFAIHNFTNFSFQAFNTCNFSFFKPDPLEDSVADDLHSLFFGFFDLVERCSQPPANQPDLRVAQTDR